MSTTLPTHPPQPRAEYRPAELTLPRPASRRPSALDRLALRAGLLLITYGRRRHALHRDELARRARSDRERAAREFTWMRAASLLLPPR